MKTTKSFKVQTLLGLCKELGLEVSFSPHQTFPVLTHYESGWVDVFDRVDDALRFVIRERDQSRFDNKQPIWETLRERSFA